MLKRLAEPFKINDHVLHVGGSAGIAIAPNDGNNVDELIANADLALYQAKSDGGRNYRFFLPVLRAQAQARRSLDLELRRAFAENEFELYFQPQVRLPRRGRGRRRGADPLAASGARHPRAGRCSSTRSARSAIAPEVGRWIMRTACEQTAAWRAAGLPLGRIGVNLFPSQLADEALARRTSTTRCRDAVCRPKRSSSKSPKTSRSTSRHAGGAAEAAREGRQARLRRFRHRLCVAELSHPLSRSPASRSTAASSARSPTTPSDAAIVRSLIAMAHNLGLEVIAEGVETDAQAAFLLNERCEEAQGYLYAKPLPAAEFEAYLSTHQLAAAMPAVAKRSDRKFDRAAGKPVGRRRLSGSVIRSAIPSRRVGTLSDSGRGRRPP